MLGRIVPGRIWESGPVRSVRRPLARLIGEAHARSIARSRERAIIEDARADAERVLAEHADLLAGGFWGLMLARKVKVGQPLDTMRRPVKAFLVNELLDDSEAMSLARAGLCPKWEVWTDSSMMTSPSSGDTTDADFCATMVMRRHPTTLFFDLRRAKVLRYSEAPFTLEYERLRRVFSHHVSSVPFEVLPGRHRLVESLAPGTPLCDIDAADRLRVVAVLLDQLAELADVAGEGDSSECLTSAADVLDQGSRVHERHEALTAWLGGSKLVVSHGDLSCANVLVSQSRPVCIDFGELAQRPAWYDGVCLITHIASQWGRRSSEGDPVGLDALLHDFLRRTVPGPLPEDWRQLVDRGYTLFAGLDLRLS